MKKATQLDQYTSPGSVTQLVIPMDIETLIPVDDSVRLLNSLIERMDCSLLYAEYSDVRKIDHSPVSLFKILAYGYLNNIYSSRKLEQACRRDINFMYLLGHKAPPDHSTIARFRSGKLESAIEDLFFQLIALLAQEGELSLTTAFIDGTKIEANANKYTFVWKKATSKNEQKLQEKMRLELPQITQRYELNVYIGEEIKVKHLKKLLKRLNIIKGKNNISFVYGKGKRKTMLQRDIEQVEAFLEKLKQYGKQIHTLGDRNSFSKTDHDATFMRMKEDHMKNGQLKPGYNVTLAVDAEYIVGAQISQERSDQRTFIPMMEWLKDLGYTKPVADAGFESEENYTWCEQNGQIAFIKPANYEQAKQKKYRSDIGRRENMEYDEERDCYTCHAGKQISFAYETKSKSKRGYETVTTVYSCQECDGCPYKEKCIKGTSKTPLEKRSKNLHVSKTFQRQRAEMAERICTEEGIQLRANRSIQVEGAFGVLKQDWGFRRFLLRSKPRVNIELLLLAIAYNIKKFHTKIKNNRCGEYLHSIKVV